MRKTVEGHDVQPWTCMMVFEDLRSFPITMGAVIHEGSAGGKYSSPGFWYNMHEPAESYEEAEGLDDNLSEAFRTTEGDFNYDRYSFALVITSGKIDTGELGGTLAYTVRDWFIEKAGCMTRTLCFDDLKEYLCWAFLEKSKKFAKGVGE